MSENLKPCPFCGWKPRLLEHKSGDYTVACRNRRCEILAVTLPGSEDEVIKAWNSRKRPKDNKTITEGQRWK